MQSLEFAQCKEFKMVDTNNNCCKCTDPQYTIVLNEQGPQGIQGIEGEDGFSPQISLYNVTDTNVQLKILNKEDTVITPNLKAQNDITFAPWTGQANTTDGTITLQGNFTTPLEVNEEVTTYTVNYGINQIGYVYVTKDGPSISIRSNPTQTYTTLTYQNGGLISLIEDYSLNNQNVLANNPLSLTKDDITYTVTWNLNYNPNQFEVNSENQLAINTSYDTNLAKLDGVNTFTGDNTFNGDVHLKNVYGGTDNVLNMTAGTITLSGGGTIGGVNLFNGVVSSGKLQSDTTSSAKNMVEYVANDKMIYYGNTTVFNGFIAPPNSNLVIYKGGTDEVPSIVLDTYNMMTYLPKATTNSLGMVKPDGTTITITEDGTITSVGGGGGSLPDNVITSDNISQNEYIQQLEQRIAALEALIDGGNSSND